MAASNKPRHQQFFNNINSLLLEGLPSASADPRSEYIPLPASFQPSNVDVICGRGRGYYNCAGNILFRETVQSFVDYYTSQPNKSAKTAVLVEIVQYMKETLKAKFVKQRPNQEGGGSSVWCELSDFLAREKVGNAMREAIAASSRNNNHHIAQRTLSPCSPPKPEPSSSSAKDVTMDMDVEMKTSTTAATLNADFSSARQRRRSSSHDKIFGRRIAFLTDRCIQQQYHRHHQQNQSVMSTGSSLASSSSSSTRQMQLSTNSATTTEIVQDDDAIMSTVLPEGGSSEFFIMDTAESMLLSTTTTTMKCSSASV